MYSVQGQELALVSIVAQWRSRRCRFAWFWSQVRGYADVSAKVSHRELVPIRARILCANGCSVLRQECCWRQRLHSTAGAVSIRLNDGGCSNLLHPSSGSRDTV